MIVGCIPAFLAAEMFRQGQRGAAMSLAALMNWVGNFLVTMTFPFVQAGIGTYSFLVFGVLATGFFVFLFLKLPETKQKPIEEIYRIFASHSTIPFMRSQSHSAASAIHGRASVPDASATKSGIDDDMIELAIRHNSVSEADASELEHLAVAPALDSIDEATGKTEEEGPHKHSRAHPAHVTICE